MKYIIFISLIILLSNMEVQGFDVLYPREDNVKPKPFQYYKLKAHTSYEDKWSMVFNSNNNQSLFSEFIDVFVNYVYDQDLLPKEFSNNLLPLLDRYEVQHPEMVEEIKAMSKVSGIDLEKLMILNFTYEIFAHQDACTSIVIRKDNGEIFLARNLDYFFEQYYCNLSIQFDYYNTKGQLEYSMSSFVGYVITVNGIRHGEYSISFNERSLETKQDNFNAFLSGAFSNEYLMRETLQKKRNYQEAVKSLTNEKIIAACYYIVAGTKNNEGIILERDREGTYKSYELTEEKWFLVATNYDEDKVDGDGRKTAAVKKIEEIGQKNMDEEVLLNEVLHQFPVFHTKTISTISMNAFTQQINETVWY